MILPMIKMSIIFKIKCVHALGNKLGKYICSDIKLI